METLFIRTNRRIDFVDITSALEQRIGKQGWTDGVLTVFIPHTSAGITITENEDPTVVAAMIKMLGELVPVHLGFTHAEGNSDAHIKTSLVGSSKQLIIENGVLKLGIWQGVFLADFDGPRQRKLWLKFIPA